MSRVVSRATIARAPVAIFSYVTTPAHWPEWHPSSLGVTGATNHSLVVGEQVTEEFSVAGRRGSTTWTVREREAPHLGGPSPAIALAASSPTSSPRARAAPSS